MAGGHKNKKGFTKVNPCNSNKRLKKVDIIWFIVIPAVYLLLQLVILPKMGIST